MASVWRSDVRSKGMILALALGIAALALPARPGFAQPSAVPSFVELADRLKRTVVSIYAIRVQTLPVRRTAPERFSERFLRGKKTDRAAPSIRRLSRGSGFILSGDGYVVTNEHVIRKAVAIQVRLWDRTRLKAVIVGIDRRTDLALLKVKPNRMLPAAVLGNSEKLKVGEWVLAIGNPFGLGHTVTAGIVSAKGRVIGAGTFDDFIQTDASINPGNSGGPLFNLEGEVVGVNTAIRRGSQGIGFSIPIKWVRRVVEDLKVHRRVVRPYLGVEVQNVAASMIRLLGLRKPEGALLSAVVGDSPAEAAGLRRGDVILSFGGTPVVEAHDLPLGVAGSRVGQKVQVRLVRNKKEIGLTVVLAEASGGRRVTPDLRPDPGLGLSVRTLTQALALKLGVAASRGVLITDVAGAAHGARAGLRKGDVIIEVNRKPVKTVEEYRKTLFPGRSSQMLLIQRGSRTTFVTVESR